MQLLDVSSCSVSLVLLFEADDMPSWHDMHVTDMQRWHHLFPSATGECGSPDKNSCILVFIHSLDKYVVSVYPTPDAD